MLFSFNSLSCGWNISFQKLSATPDQSIKQWRDHYGSFYLALSQGKLGLPVGRKIVWNEKQHGSSPSPEQQQQQTQDSRLLWSCYAPMRVVVLNWRALIGGEAQMTVESANSDARIWRWRSAITRAGQLSDSLQHKESSASILGSIKFWEIAAKMAVDVFSTLKPDAPRDKRVFCSQGSKRLSWRKYKQFCIAFEIW